MLNGLRCSLLCRGLLRCGLPWFNLLYLPGDQSWLSHGLRCWLSHGLLNRLRHSLRLRLLHRLRHGLRCRLLSYRLRNRLLSYWLLNRLRNRLLSYWLLNRLLSYRLRHRLRRNLLHYMRLCCRRHGGRFFGLLNGPHFGGRLGRQRCRWQLCQLLGSFRRTTRRFCAWARRWHERLLSRVKRRAQGYGHSFVWRQLFFTTQQVG